RQEKSETDTLIGVMPDNLAVSQVPGMMPRLALYLRGHFPVTKPPSAFALRLEFGGGRDPVNLAQIDPATIAEAAKQSRTQGNNAFGLIVKAQLKNFIVQQEGRISAVATVGDEEWLVGSLNIIVPAKETQPQAIAPRAAPQAVNRAPSSNKKRVGSR